jgi:hypothetical protein
VASARCRTPDHPAAGRRTAAAELCGTEKPWGAPHRTPPPAGGGSRARPSHRCRAQRSQRPHRRARITLEAPPDHEEGRSGAPSRAGGRSTTALLTRMAIAGDVNWGRAPGVQHRWASP